jgi:hypothetical protein
MIDGSIDSFTPCVRRESSVVEKIQIVFKNHEGTTTKPVRNLEPRYTVEAKTFFGSVDLARVEHYS